MGRHRSAAMQSGAALWSPTPPTAAPLLLAAIAKPEPHQSPGKGNMFRRCGGGASLRFCPRPPPTGPMGRGRPRARGGPGFAVARAAASLGQ